MDILIFIVVLVVLIVAHEFGHLIAAKLSGMKVEEFGIGYPPKALSVHWGGTEYSLNWLPFGGFVKIYGEDGQEETTPGEANTHVRHPMSDMGAKGRGFSDRPRILQALVLVAGIAMNIVLAWLIFSLILFVGMPRALSPEEATRAPDAALVVASVLPGSPADHAGLRAGDTIEGAYRSGSEFSSYVPEEFTAFVSAAREDEEIGLSLLRDDEQVLLSVTPREGIVQGDPERRALGVAVATIGTVPVSLLEAPIAGALFTWYVVKETAIGLYHFFGGLFTFTADLAQISGPVGIVGAVGQASAGGLIDLLTLTAVISINLALINLLPVPALDGGRLLFVAIEAALNRPIPKGVAGALNTVGFALLILLMLVVTASDIWKIVG